MGGEVGECSSPSPGDGGLPIFNLCRIVFLAGSSGECATPCKVQRLSGHSLARVAGIYGHLKPNQMHDMVRRISVLMS